MPNRTINWKGLIFNNCEILEPVDSSKITGSDKWKIKCLHDNNIFEARPNHIKFGCVKSCGCLIKKIIRKGKARQYNYYNYKNPETNIEIIKPVDPLKDGPKDKWIVLCNRNGIDHPKEFIARPNNIISGTTGSCGCLNKEKILERHKKYRILNHCDENEHLTKNILLIRNEIVRPIQQLILKIDNFTCNLCLKQKSGHLELHHIIPLCFNANTYKPEDYFKIYDIDNLITLCKKCHLHLAHDGMYRSINLNIQEELKTIISMRKIDKSNYDKYLQIVDEEVKPKLFYYFGVKL